MKSVIPSTYQMAEQSLGYWQPHVYYINSKLDRKFAKVSKIKGFSVFWRSNLMEVFLRHFNTPSCDFIRYFCFFQIFSICFPKNVHFFPHFPFILPCSTQNLIYLVFFQLISSRCKTRHACNQQISMHRKGFLQQNMISFLERGMPYEY